MKNKKVKAINSMEVVTCKRRTICKCCGKRILKGDTAIRIYAPFQKEGGILFHTTDDFIVPCDSKNDFSSVSENCNAHIVYIVCNNAIDNTYFSHYGFKKCNANTFKIIAKNSESVGVTVSNAIEHGYHVRVKTAFCDKVVTSANEYRMLTQKVVSTIK